MPCTIIDFDKSVVRCKFALVFLLCACATGCHDKQKDLVPVSGTVLLDKKPLPNADIKFVPDHGRPSLARTDENGHFELIHYRSKDGTDIQGALLGSHRMTVDARDQISSKQTRWRAPQKYARLETTPLNCTITESRSDLVIELSWDGKKPFVENH